MPRLFIALPIPEQVADHLLDLMDEALPIRWTDSDRFHLTLRFIGDVDGDVADDLALALSGLHSPALDLHLHGVGHFHHRQSGALWAAARPREPITDLAAKIGRAVGRAGIPSERRAFIPHVTIGRWSGSAPDLGAWLARHSTFTTDPWLADRMTLFESRLGRAGPTYRAAMEVPLVAPPSASLATR